MVKRNDNNRNIKKLVIFIEINNYKSQINHLVANMLKYFAKFILFLFFLFLGYIYNLDLMYLSVVSLGKI